MTDTADYKDLVKEFGEERINERKVYLYSHAKVLISRHQLEPDDFYISPIAINSVAINYFSDLSRLKHFHDIDRGNKVKIAAYTCYWIIKEKPIQLIRDEYEKKHAEKINYLFAYSVMLDIMFITEKRLFTDNLGKFNDFTDLLLYNFRYRVLTPQSLELTFEALLTSELPYEENHWVDSSKSGH